MAYSAAYLANIELVEKDDRSFKLKKVVGPNTYHVSFDLRSGQMTYEKNGEQLTPRESNFDTFFRTQQSRNEVLDLISTDITRDLFRLAHDSLGCQGEEKVQKWARGLGRLNERKAYQVLYFAGFSCDQMQQLRNLDNEKTRPQDIFDLPKYMLPYLKKMNYLTKGRLGALRELHAKLGSNNAKRFMDILMDENCLDDFFTISGEMFDLMDKHGYTDACKLILYLVRDVKVNQGITSPRAAVILMRDYCKMAKAMDYVRFERFPKNLKKDHDITAMNYKVQESEIKNKMFKQAVSAVEYTKLAHIQEDYSITVPESVQTVIGEGSSLGHCVASYVDDIIDERCKILFLRETDKLNTPLVTVEVRHDKVRQIRGQSNRRPYERELSFVKHWAKKNKLTVDTY